MNKLADIINIELAVTTVNNIYNTNIRTDTRRKEVSIPRQIYIYCMSKCTKYGSQRIVETVNRRNHSTALHAIKTVEDRLWYDDKFRKEVKIVLEKIKNIYKDDGNYTLNKETYDATAIWLNFKDMDIDIKSNKWMQEKAPIMTYGKLIEYIIQFKNEMK